MKANGDSGHFIFEITGGIDDEMMERANAITDTERIKYLKSTGLEFQIVDTATEEARMNLIMCGGFEIVHIIGGMLKKYYFENLCRPTSMEDCVEYLAAHDVAGYGFENLRQTYRMKIGQFLLSAFSGMRLDKPWNGREEVHGHYIVVNNDFSIEEFHSPFAYEFRDYLGANMQMECPTFPHPNHTMIYKDGNRYLLRIALQLRLNQS
ncbi:MAG: HpaII family restriction endonuclease [Muribaculaceae bacterium]